MDVSSLSQTYPRRVAALPAASEVLPQRRSSPRLAIAVVCGVIGAALPLLLPSGMMKTYTGEARLEVGVEAGASTNRQAVVAAAVRKVREADHLDRIIHVMDLRSDPEFASATPSTWRFVSELFSRREMTVAAAETELRERVSGAIDITPAAGGASVGIRARSANAATATRLANMVTEELQRELDQASARQEGEAVVAARSTLEAAQAALDADGADEGALSAMRRAEAEKRILDEEKARLDQRKANLADQITAVSGLKAGDVIAKGLPDVLTGSSLDAAWRKRLEAKLSFDQMSVDLGPRHPRFIAAKAALDDADAGIERALKAITTSLKQQDAALEQEKQALDGKIAALAAKPVPEAMRKRAELEAAVDTARKTYLDVLRREETSGRAPTVFASVSVPARVQTALMQGYPFWAYSLWGGLVGALGALFVLMMRTREVDETPEYSHRADAMVVPVSLPVTPVMAKPAKNSDLSVQLVADELPELKRAPAAEPLAFVSAPAKLPLPLTSKEPAPVLRRPANRPIEEIEQRVMANDLSLTEQIERMLMDNRQSADALAEPLPSLVASILNRDMVPASHLQLEPQAMHDTVPVGIDPEELRDLHEELQRLRRELSHYGRQDRAA